MSKSSPDSVPTQGGPSSKWADWLHWTVAILLGLGMFPSFLALSERISNSFPALSRYLGPINFLKLFWPLILLEIVLQFSRIPRRARIGLPVIFGIGTVATLIAGKICHFPPLFMREWMVICLGSLASIALCLLPRRCARVTVVLWMVIVLTGVAINFFFPSVTNLIFRTFFDYHYVVDEVPMSGLRLSGFYDIASLGKLLAWLPWLFGLFFILPGSQKRGQWFVVLGLALVCFMIVPVTTQRGPVLGVALGCAFAAAHQIFRVGRAWLLKWIPVALVTVLLLGWFVVPREIVQKRFLDYLGIGAKDSSAIVASRNSSDQRMRVWKLSFERAKTHPLGCPCPPKEDFDRAGIEGVFHSHNLFLEQYASRGWLWGTVHLALWLMALVYAWRDRSWEGTFLVGGVMTTLGLGLVDHPWFVLNHAMILGTFLFYYWIHPVARAQFSLKSGHPVEPFGRTSWNAGTYKDAKV